MGLSQQVTVESGRIALLVPYCLSCCAAFFWDLDRISEESKFRSHQRNLQATSLIDKRRISHLTNAPPSQHLNSPTQMHNSPSDSREMGKGFVLPLSFFTLVSFVMVGPHVLPPTEISTLPYAVEDSNIFLWGFWWIKRSLLALHNPYWTDLLFHPLGTSLAFHTLPITYGLFSVPIQLLIKGPIGLAVAFNSVIFLSFVLSGFGAYRLAAYVTGSLAGGLIAGLIFAFMPFHFLNINSLNLLAIEFLPFYILSLLKLRDQPTVRQGFLVATWLALAFYTSLEYALFLVIFSILWLIYQLSSKFRGIDRKFLKYLALAAFSFIVFAAPLLFQQASFFSRQETTIKRDIAEVVFWSPALLSFITPSRLHPVYGEAMSQMDSIKYGTKENWGMRSEASLGFATLVLAIAAMIGFRRDGRLFWVLAALLFLCLSLGPYLRLTGHWLSQIPLPYLLLYKFHPIFQVGRDPTRFVPLAVLMLSLCAAFSVRDLSQRINRIELRILVTALLAGAVLFQNLTGWASGFKPEINPIYRDIGQMPGDFAIIDLTPEPNKLLPQTVHGKRITYLSATIPRTSSKNWVLPIEYDFRFPEKLLGLDSDELGARFREHRVGLKEFNIRYVIFPINRNAKLQIELATRLGGSVKNVQGLFLCEFP